MGAKNGSINGDIHTVYVFPLSSATRDRLRTSKAKMDVEYRIVPEQAYAGAGRVVAFQKVPWLALEGIAEISESTSEENLAAAIHWAATGEFDSRVSTAEQQLSKIFGKPVTEISKDQLAFENASRSLDLDNKKKVRFGK